MTRPTNNQHRSDPPGNTDKTDIEQLSPKIDDPEIQSLDPAPITFTGETDITDPRQIRITKKFIAGLSDGMDEQFTAGEIPPRKAATGEEKQMQLQRELKAEFTAKFTPKPLTASQLDTEVAECTGSGDETVWVRPEPTKYIAHTAVGEYRETVEGEIVRFAVEVSDNTPLLEFALVPDLSPTGFSWYITTNEKTTKKGSLDASQARRLEAITNCSATRQKKILNITEKVRLASILLDKPLVGAELHCLPDGWINTSCKIDGAATEPLHPRYKGTFVHSDSDIVVEFDGIPATTQSDGSGPTRRQSRRSSHADNSTQSGTHNYEVHFAPESVRHTIETEFGESVTGREMRHILRDIQDRV